MSEREKNPEREEQKGSGRREFLRKSGKILAYSVPVIYSLQSRRLKAQEMSAGSAGRSVANPPDTEITEPDLPRGLGTR
jgi:hypothetical protein